MKRKVWFISLFLVPMASMAFFFACSPSSSRMKTVNLDTNATLHAQVMTIVDSVSKQQGTPQTITGSCGGQLVLSSNSQGNTTTGTASFQNFCFRNTTASNRLIVKGDIPFSFTTTQSGSVSNFSADAPDLNLKRTNPAGTTTIETSDIGFTKLVLTAGNPSVTTIEKLNFNVNVANQPPRSLMLQNVTIKQVPGTGGASTVAISGRAFVDETGYSDFKTPDASPLRLNASGAPTPGDQIVVTGANNSTATFTVVTGSPLLFSVSVNGTPLTSQLSCPSVVIPTLPAL